MWADRWMVGDDGGFDFGIGFLLPTGWAEKGIGCLAGVVGVSLLVAMAIYFWPLTVAVIVLTLGLRAWLRRRRRLRREALERARQARRDARREARARAVDRVHPGRVVARQVAARRAARRHRKSPLV